MDAVISIGQQSLIDGILRLVGPALQALRAPMPIVIPGLSNSLLTIHNITPMLPSGAAGQVKLRVDLELSGEALLVASLAAEHIELAISLNPMTGSIALPGGAQPINLQGVTGTLGLVPNNPPLPPPDTPAPLPLPAVVPVPVDLTGKQSVSASVFLSVSVNGAALNSDVAISSGWANSLQVAFTPASVDFAVLPPAFATTIENSLNTAINNLVTQLTGQLVVLQPTRDVAAISKQIAADIPAAVQSTLTDAFSQMVGRTGRLIFPTPGAGSSCEVDALPTAAKARLSVGADGSLILQLGFNRGPIASGDAFPAFVPSGTTDVRVWISNAFLRDLLCCLVEKMPNIALLPAGRATSDTVVDACCTWPNARVNVGMAAFAGTVELCVVGTQGSAKEIQLRFDLSASVRPHFSIGGSTWPEIFNAHLAFMLRTKVNLNELAKLTSLRVLELDRNVTVDIGLSAAFWAFLILVGVTAWTTGLLGASVLVLVLVAVAVVKHVLRNALELILSPARLLESPAAIPAGVFEAFGGLVPATVEIDDLEAGGVLNTPTSPWTVLPMLRRVRRPPDDRPDGPRDPLSSSGEGDAPIL